MHEPVPPLQGENIAITTFLQQSAEWKNSVLGTLCFSVNPAESQVKTVIDVPCLHLPMQQLDEDDSSCEVWLGAGHVTQGQCGAIEYRHDEEVLFGVMELSEALFETAVDKTPLQQTTEAAYRQVFALLEQLRFPYLFRFWNYIADINAHSFGLERYRQFNQGRQDAFLAHGRDVVGNVPAACALGFGPGHLARGPLTIAFLAGRVAPLNIENPRQISAYEYPQQYGPRSPTFSRASLVRMGPDEVLFISGTASIVGHATLHPSDIVSQTREIMTNIQAVLTESNKRANAPGFDLSSLYYKVYVRHPVDLAQIRAELEDCVGNKPKAIYLQADICRQDLLLEIEATAVHPLAYISGRLG